MFLAGRPGSGKSMALGQLAVALAKEGQIPVLVQLKGNVPILKAIADELENGDLEFDEKEIKRLLRQQQLILLLDGINETKDDLRETLQPFRERYRTTPMIFTTRDLAIGGDLGIGKRFEMKPLSPEQLREFVGKYLPGQGERLLEQLRDRLKELSETPLLLKMLCEVFDPETDQIPQNKGELFREFDRKYEQFKGLPAVSPDFRRFKSEVLQHLAFVMMTGDEGKPTELELTIDRTMAEKAIENLVAGRVSDPGPKAKEWLEDLLEHHLLQVATDDRRVEFRHQLFQEYYAAEHLMSDRHRLLEWLVVKPNQQYSIFQQDYLNYLKWTETIAIVLSLIKDEEAAVRVVTQALDVDLMLGARLAGEVRSGFQERTVNLLSQKKNRQQVKLFWIKVGSYFVKMPLWLSVALLAQTNSEAAIPGLMNALGDSDNDVSTNASEALGRMGSNVAILGLLDASKHPNAGVRKNAVSALGLMRLEDAIPHIFKMLEDPDVWVRVSATKALGFIGTEAVTPGLLKAIKDSETIVCMFAALALSSINSESAILQLLKALEDCDSFVRARAAFALGFIGSAVAIPGLRKKLEDSDEFVRKSAANSLEMLGVETDVPTSFSEIYDFPEIHDFDTDLYKSIGPDTTIPNLLKTIKNSDDKTRWAVVSTLSNFKADRAAHILPKLLQLLPTDSGKAAFKTIQGIQSNCKFYNYEVQRAKLRKADRASLGGGGGKTIINQFPNATEVKIFENVQTYHESPPRDPPN